MPTKIVNIIKDRHQSAEDYLVDKRTLWDEYENIHHNRLADKVSGTTKSQVFDPKLSTFLMERAYRVMSQLMTGKVRGISKNDRGAEKLMNLVLDKYVVPNANAQWNFLTKARMVDMYSNVYGNFFTLVDWSVRKDGYMGPDTWLINIRDVFPQVGAVSLTESDYIIIRSWQPISFFENLEKKDGYKNVPTIITKLKDKSGSKDTRDSTNKSQRESNAYPSSPPAKGQGYFEVLSMYEKDRWVDYCVDAQLVFRDRDNQHDNNELPIAAKYSIPLLDDFMGMGDYERGKSMQYTLNSVWNLYLDAVKMSIFPPTILNKDNMAVMSSFKFKPAAKWISRNSIDNVAKTLNLSPQGVNTFDNTYKLVTSSIMNMFGTSDTSTVASTDPNFGKTPQALKMQSARENSRDVADRYFMEEYLTTVMKKFVNLVSKKQSKQILVRMFDEEINDLINEYPKLEKMYDKKKGNLRINKGKTGKILYDYEIVPGSTYALDQEKQQSNLVNLLASVKENMQVGQDGRVTSPFLMRLEQEGKDVKVGELLTRILNSSGITDWDKIVVDSKNEDGQGQNQQQDAQVLDQHEAEFQQMLTQAQQEGVGNIPPQPGQGYEQPGIETQLP